MRRPQMNRLLWIGLACALVAGLLAPRLGLLPGAQSLDSGLLLDQPRPLKPWRETMINDAGQTFALEDFRDRHHLLFFGFAGCPDICPDTLLVLSRVYRELPAEARERLQILLVSLDPERDTPERLQQYVRHFHPDFRAITGSEAALEDLTGQAGIAWLKVPLGEGYTIDHSSALVLLDPQARISAYFAPPLDEAAVTADLAQLLR